MDGDIGTTHLFLEADASTMVEDATTTAAPPTTTDASNSNGISSVVRVLIGRIARKKKRKQGIELAVREEKSEEPPLVVCIVKSEVDALVQHPVFVQLDALVRVQYVEDASLWCGRRVVSLELLECPGEPQAVQAVLKRPSLWHCLHNSSEEEEELDFQAKNQHYLVRQLVARLQGRTLETPRERPPLVKYHTLQALEALEKETPLVDIATSYILNTTSNPAEEDLVCLPVGEQDDWNLPEHERGVVLKSNHHKLTRVEYLQRKKYPQIRWLLQRLQDLPYPFQHVLDVGGGRGDLAIQVARRFAHAHVSVVDCNATSLKAGQAFAEKRGVADRMHWIQQDFRDYLIQTTEDSQLPKIDLVIAWHACGDLTDLALQIGLQHRAALVVCPCCYSKLPNQTSATQLAELQGRPDLSRRGMRVVNSQRHSTLTDQGYCVSLEEYSAEWSGRNQVLVAHPSSTSGK